MKHSFHIGGIAVLLLLLMAGCADTESEETTQPHHVDETGGELPDLSVYHLPASWQTQTGDTIELEDLRGKVVVMVMIYTSCQAACPRLVADMRNIEKQVPDELEDQVRYVFVSIDPEVDTPERLQKFAEDNFMTDDKWLFLRGSEGDTREFAAVLAVGYRRISPIDFSHSNIISVFNREGVLEYQKEGLGTDDTKTIEAITRLAESN